LKLLIGKADLAELDNDLFFTNDKFRIVIRFKILIRSAATI
jgi:hypothetical protein